MIGFTGAEGAHYINIITKFIIAEFLRINLFQTASIDRSAQVFVQPARCNIAEDPELYGRHFRAAQSASG